MQCNRIPHQLESMLVPVTGFSFKEVSCSIGAVDFEPLVLRHEVAVPGPAKVVQDRSYGMGFEITALELGGLCRDDEAEEPGSHAVIVTEVIEMLTAKSEGFGYQVSIGDLDSSEDSSGERCHCVEIKGSRRFLRGRRI